MDKKKTKTNQKQTLNKQLQVPEKKQRIIYVCGGLGRDL